MPRAHSPTILFTTYTPCTLVRFDGKDGGGIFLAIAGTVFDVTAGRGFYGPGRRGTEPESVLTMGDAAADGIYGNFAGRDASRGMAKQSFDLGALPAVCIG